MEFYTEPRSHYGRYFSYSLRIYKRPFEIEFCTEPQSYDRSDLQLSHPWSKQNVLPKTIKYIV